MLISQVHSKQHRTASQAVYLCLFLIVMAALPNASEALNVDKSPAYSLYGKSYPEKNSKINIDRPYFYSTKEHLTPEQILESTDVTLWREFDSASIVPTSRDASLWFTFKLHPQDIHDASELESWVFVLTWALLEHAQIHTLNHDTGELWSSKPIGIDYPVSERYFNSRQFVFPLPEVKSDAVTVLLEIRSSNLLTFPGSIMTEKDFIKSDVLDTLVIGAAIGSLLVMLLYNISLCWALKERSYFYYSAYIIAVTFYLLAASGVGYSHIWNDFSWLKFKAFPIFSSLAFITMIFFIRDFLNLKEYHKSFIIGNDIFLILWGIMLAISLVSEDAWVVTLLSLLAFLSSGFGVILALSLSFKKNIDAIIFMFAWSIFIVFSFIFVLALYGFLPFNSFNRYSQMFGIILELVFLSFALAYRINDVKKTREEAQQESLLLTKRVSDERRERLKAQLETLDVHKRMNENLEREVELRTQQLEATKTKLEGMNATLTKLSVTDPLSGIHNRRYFDDKLIEECKRAFRIKQPLAVIIADIDNFKPINDNFGHVIGDECIRETAYALKSGIRRPSDLLARYGGEEFVFILPGGDLEEATQVAENCRIAVEAIDFTFEGKRIGLTVSAGVASWIPSSENSYKELLKAADSALYHAKNSGRNCVQIAERSAELF
ncbi:MAG: sensor domain-containing diguanylate cyclase [Cellvibrionaceae bacterium]